MATLNEIRPEEIKAALRAREAHLAYRELDGFLDDSLGKTAHVRAESHLAECPRCATELSLLREFRSIAPRPEEADAVRLITGRLARSVSMIFAGGTRTVSPRVATETEDAELLVAC